jgi:hypothetical protein
VWTLFGVFDIFYYFTSRTIDKYLKSNTNTTNRRQPLTMDKTSCIQHYNSTPHFNYCFTVLTGIGKQSRSLNPTKAPNKGMRAILQCPYRTHRVDMLRELDWLSIHQHIVYKSIMFIWDVLHGDNEELKKFLRQNSDVHSYNTRSCMTKIAC